MKIKAPCLLNDGKALLFYLIERISDKYLTKKEIELQLSFTRAKFEKHLK